MSFNVFQPKPNPNPFTSSSFTPVKNKREERNQSLPRNTLLQPPKKKKEKSILSFSHQSFKHTLFPDLYGLFGVVVLVRVTERKQLLSSSVSSDSSSLSLISPSLFFSLHTSLSFVLSSSFEISGLGFFYPLRSLVCEGDKMMKNKGKGVSIGGGSSSPYAFDEETRNKFKHQNLMQDFVDLQKETEAMKKRLQKGKQRKQTLLAEVCFLRRRYKFLKRIQTPKTPSSERGPSRFQVPEIHREAVAMPNRSPVLDLNQISNGEEAVGEYQTYHEPQRMHKRPKNHSNNVGDQQQQSNDVKLSVCREVVNGSNRSGKRKISWQDQVALRV